MCLRGVGLNPRGRGQSIARTSGRHAGRPPALIRAVRGYCLHVRENVDIVRGFISSFNRANKSALTDFFADDVEIDWSRSPAPYRGVYRGRAAAVQWFADVGDTFETGRIEPADFIDAGDDVVVPHVFHLQGRDGIEVKGPGRELCLHHSRRTVLSVAHLSSARRAVADLRLAE